MAKKVDLITVRAEFELLKNDIEVEKELTEELQAKIADKDRVLKNSLELLQRKKQEITSSKRKRAELLSELRRQSEQYRRELTELKSNTETSQRINTEIRQSQIDMEIRSLNLRLTSLRQHFKAKSTQIEQIFMQRTHIHKQKRQNYEGIMSQICTKLSKLEEAMRKSLKSRPGKSG